MLVNSDFKGAIETPRGLKFSILVSYNDVKWRFVNVFKFQFCSEFKGELKEETA